MIYITYAKSTGMYASPDEISTYKKVLNGDSFEITSFYLTPKSAKPLDRDRSSESIEYHQNAVFTIRTDAGETEEFNIDVGLIYYKPSSYYRTTNTILRQTETHPYLIRFGIACPKETVYFEPYKEKLDYVYSNTQLVNWLKEKTSYIDDNITYWYKQGADPIGEVLKYDFYHDKITIATMVIANPCNEGKLLFCMNEQIEFEDLEKALDKVMVEYKKALVRQKVQEIDKDFQV